MKAAMLVLIGLIPACQSDETAAGYGAAGAVWTLVEQDGARPPAHVTLSFGQDGTISGHAPCNAFTTTSTVPYPWFEPGTIAATKKACPDLPSESAFFTTLRAMAFVEVLGDTMILRNDAGVELVFKATE